MSNTFNGQILAEKLSKLNNSQQSIETLSHWCIFHRKKAKLVVETWEKLFNSSPKEQRVAFLYLSNDILQNSRRKGSEFVNEFWKVLPRALKSVFENGDDHGKNAVTRLVDIWDERKVFGSRSRGLKDELLGKEPPQLLSKEPPLLLENNGKSSHSIKIVRRDAHSIRIKLALGGMPEKIVTAFQSVHDEHFSEDAALNKCKATVHRMGKMKKDVDDTCAQGNQQGSGLVSELQEQETILKQCIEQLKSVEATRAALVSQLKEALQEQESKLELIHSQLQVAQAETEHASNMRQRLTSAPVPGSGAGPSPSSAPTTLPIETVAAAEQNPPSQISNAHQLQPSQLNTSFVNPLTTAEEKHKKAAAAVAAKLAASTSSAQMLASVLSSLVAEEAASMNGSMKSGSFATSLPMFPLEKRPKLEKPSLISDMGTTYFGHVQQQQLASIPFTPPQSTAATVQPGSQINLQQPPFPPPQPSLPPPPPSVQQYVQSSGAMVGAVSYGYGGSALPPPPPIPSHVLMGLARHSAPQPPPPPPPPHQQQQQQSQPLLQQQQQPVTTGFYQSPKIGFYGQPSITPVPRQ